MENTSANFPKKFDKTSPSELDLFTFFEFISNAKENTSVKNIANLTVLTLMGRLKLKNGTITVGELEIIKGKTQKKYLIKRALTYGKKKFGEIKLGGEKEKISLTKSETTFVDTICQLSTLLLKNIDNVSRLKDTNKKLSKKILQLESIFEASREMLFTKDIENCGGEYHPDIECIRKKATPKISYVIWAIILILIFIWPWIFAMVTGQSLHK